MIKYKREKNSLVINFKELNEPAIRGLCEAIDSWNSWTFNRDSNKEDILISENKKKWDWVRYLFTGENI